MTTHPPPQEPRTIRAWDRRAIEEFGLPGVVLMENAGAGAARWILKLLRDEPEIYSPPVAILCGPGNNGGDGFVVARHLHNAGVGVEVHLAMDPTSVDRSSDAGIHLQVLQRTRIPVLSSGPPYPPPACLAPGSPSTVVDALLGTGLSRPLQSPILEWVQAVNRSRCPVISLDLPTGLDGTSGEIHGDAVRARSTVTFAAAKVGFYRGEGPQCCGHVHVVDIGMPPEIFDEEGEGG